MAGSDCEEMVQAVVVALVSGCVFAIGAFTGYTRGVAETQQRAIDARVARWSYNYSTDEPFVEFIHPTKETPRD